MKPAAPVAALSMLLIVATAASAAGPPAPRALIVQVRDTPPQGAAGFRHGSDGSYSVSTGSGDRDDRAEPAGNATTLSTSRAVRLLHIVEGQRVRVDLPGVQSLQFHLPLSANAAAAGQPAAGAPATAAGTAGNAGNGASAPTVAGVVTFEAVTAFAARFMLAGPTVRVELTPLRTGTVAAPYSPAAGAAAPTSVTVQGRVGEWIALGGTELSDPGVSLNTSADAARPASVWVRVDPDPAGPSH